MNPLLNAMRYHAYGGGSATTTALWSVIFASAIAGDDIVVGASELVLMDMASTPVYGSITINGQVFVDKSKSTALNFEEMTIDGGRYFAGDLATPYPRTTVTHTLTPSGTRASDPQIAAPAGPAVASANRGIMVMNGGEIALCADVPPVTIFKLGATATAGDASITADQPVTFKAGERLEIGTSMYWQETMGDVTAISAVDDGTNATQFGRRPGYGSEIVTVASDVTNSTTIPINHCTYMEGNTPTSRSTLWFTHHGRLQYLVPPSREDQVGTNLSYTAYTIQASDSFGTVNGHTITGTQVLAAIAAGANPILDNRSTVGLLTHPIKFGAPLDSDWTTHGFGAHMMVMGRTSKKMLQGVERYRCGQAGFLGRYPDHDHMRSYTSYGTTGSGTYLGDVDPTYNFSQYTSTYRSSNRGVSIHGTCAANYYKNVYSQTDTHCIFLEDGSEERNVIDGNFVSGVGRIGYGKTVIKQHDTLTTASSSGPAGIWYTNPQNYLRNNIVSGAAVGIWNAMSLVCFGASREVAITPYQLVPLEWDNNEAHSCSHRQMMSILFAIDEAGNTGTSFPGWLGSYSPHALYNDIFTTVIRRAKLWKGYVWYENRAFGVDYTEWSCAGLKDWNTGIGPVECGVHGVAEGRFNKGSFFTHTLDDYYRTVAESLSITNKAPVMMTSYHNAAHRQNSIFVAAPMGAMHLTHGTVCREWNDGGTLQMWDYYDNPADIMFDNDRGCAYLGANPGYVGVMFPPAFLLGQFAATYLTALGIGAADLSSCRQHAAHKLPGDSSMFGQTGWWVFDDPFFTSGVTGSVYAEAPTGLTNLNGKLIPSTYNYLGVWALSVGGQDVIDNGKKVYYTRYASDYTTSLGTWNTVTTAPNYINARFASCLAGGYFDVAWDRTEVPLSQCTALKIWVNAMTFAGADLFLSADWNHAQSVFEARIEGRGGETITVAPVANKAALLASTTASYFVDTVNDKIYMHVYRASSSNTSGDIEAYMRDNLQTVYIN